MQKVNALAKLERYDEADQILRLMFSNIRFQDEFSLIETKLANISELQGDIDYAMDMYYDIIRKYPKKEGAALSAFYLGQLYEFEYGNFDSAKVYYDRVNKEYNRSEAKEEATTRANLLKEYLTIRDQINKDKSDLYKLEHGDSLLIDSVAVEPSPEDTIQVEETDPFEDFNTAFTFPSDADQDTVNSDSSAADQDSTSDKTGQTASKKKVIQKKQAVSRDPFEVEGSLVKNSFAISEYFLLKYQNYDSSLTRYTRFVNNFSDSILTPKALYSIYFLYHTIYKNEIKADSVKNLIIDHYFNTPYGEKLSGKISSSNDELSKTLIDSSKIKYLKAENYLDNEDYNNAIKLFKDISEQDSGSIWAQKARYAVAYTYENYITDTASAIQSYQILANEYPKTEFGKIAIQKIAEPNDEILTIEKSADETPEYNINEDNEKFLEEKESDYIPIDPAEIIDTDMLDSKRPAKTFRGFEQNEKDNLKNEIVKKNIKREESNNFIRDKKRNDMVPVDSDSAKTIDID